MAGSRHALANSCPFLHSRQKLIPASMAGIDQKRTFAASLKNGGMLACPSIDRNNRNRASFERTLPANDAYYLARFESNFHTRQDFGLAVDELELDLVLRTGIYWSVHVIPAKETVSVSLHRLRKLAGASNSLSQGAIDITCAKAEVRGWSDQRRLPVVLICCPPNELNTTKGQGFMQLARPGDFRQPATGRACNCRACCQRQPYANPSMHSHRRIVARRPNVRNGSERTCRFLASTYPLL